MARILDEELERLKREVSVERLARARGVELKRHGQDLSGLCPFHKDSSPSLVISPGRNLWHCLGACQAGGSVVDWVMKAEGVSFRHAVELLRADMPAATSGRVGIGRNGEEPAKKTTVRRLPPPVALDAGDAELLCQVVDYYHQTLKQSPEALDYLKKRGLNSAEAIHVFKLGFANRTLGLRLPMRNREAGAAVRGRLQRLGLLRESGHEHFTGSLVIPSCDADGQVLGLYGRKITPGLRPGTPLHLYLPGPHKGVFNEAELVRHKTVILCEALIDALTFWCAGFRNVTASYGVEGFTPQHLEALRRNGILRVLIAYDRDDAGDAAAETLGKKLIAEGFECYRVQFPRGMDANEYALKTHPGSRTQALGMTLRQAVWMGKGKGTPVPPFVAEPQRTPPVKPPSLVAQPLPARAMAVLEQLGPEAKAAAAVGVATADAAMAAEGRRERPGAAAPRPAPKAPAAASPEPLVSSVPPTVLSSEIRTTTTASPTMPTSSPSSTNPAKPPPVPVEASAPQVPAAAAAPAPLLPAIPRAPEVDAEVTEEEVVLRFGPRRYRVRGLGKALSAESLKLNLLVSQGEAFHVDTLELYSARQRAAWVKQAAEELRQPEEALKREMGALLLKLEELQEKHLKEKLAPKPVAPALSEDEREAALELLKSPNLLERILSDFERCGVVGEETNKLVGYLAAVSRKLDEPLAVLIQSSSAAGKTALMEAVLAFVPEEDKTKYSAMTGQSLFYMGDADLKHKVLAVVEEEGASRASYALKLLQSEGELRIASTGKDPTTGRLVTHEYRVEGPTQLFLTTTAPELDEELLNRCVVLTVDEERGQTQAIHRLQRERQTLEGLLARREREAVLKVHQDAQRLVRPLLVANPFAKALTFLDDRTRCRRDFPKYLTLIRGLALLHQHQRPVKTVQHNGEVVEYVEATLEDVAVANRLAHQVLGRSLDDLPPQTRRLLHQVEAFVDKLAADRQLKRGEVRFTRRELREAVRLSDTQLKLHLSRLVELELLAVHRTQRGGFAYELLYDGQGKDGTPFLTGLVDVEALRQQYDVESNGERSGSGRPLVGPRSGGGRSASDGEFPSGGEDFPSPAAEGAVKALPGRATSGPSYAQAAV